MPHQFSTKPRDALPVLGPLDGVVVFRGSDVVAEGEGVVLLGRVGRRGRLGVQLGIEEADVGGSDKDEEGSDDGIGAETAVGVLGYGMRL